MEWLGLDKYYQFETSSHDSLGSKRIILLLAARDTGLVKQATLQLRMGEIVMISEARK